MEEVFSDEDDDDEEVEVDFSAKKALEYKLPSLQLFSPDKPKDQSKEKKIVRENIKILEETFASFGIKVTVERAEIGPSVTLIPKLAKVSSKILIFSRTSFFSFD